MSMIKINVAQQLKESVGSVRNYEINDTTDEGLSIHGEVRLLRTNRSILVTGRLETAIKGICSRCLEEFVHPLILDIEEEYSLPKNVAGTEPVTSSNDAPVFAIDENNILDLSEAVRQYTLISTPMKPICRQNCAGLCPYCGCNLNYGTCECRPVRPDSPWAKLESLRSGE